MSIAWVTAFLDRPPETAAASEVFWSALTGTTMSQRRGERAEFATLLPPDGDAYLRVQEVGQSVPGALHLDLACDDREAETRRQLALGAEVVRCTEDWTTPRDPAGRLYCTTRRPPGLV